jgi:hypothetical protein
MLYAHWRPLSLNAKARVKTPFLPPPIYRCKQAHYQHVMFCFVYTHRSYWNISRKDKAKRTKSQIYLNFFRRRQRGRSDSQRSVLICGHLWAIYICVGSKRCGRRKCTHLCTILCTILRANCCDAQRDRPQKVHDGALSKKMNVKS